MAFITSTDGSTTVWSYRERDQIINWFSDQYRTAAERLARRVEEYLFDRRSPNYQEPVFLSWAIAQFDNEKQGSGGPGHNVAYNRDVAVKESAAKYNVGENVFPPNRKDVMSHVPQEQLDFLSADPEGDA